MVSNLSLAGMIFTLLVSFLLPIGLIIYAKKGILLISAL